MECIHCKGRMEKDTALLALIVRATTFTVRPFPHGFPSNVTSYTLNHTKLI